MQITKFWRILKSCISSDQKFNNYGASNPPTVVFSDVPTDLFKNFELQNPLTNKLPENAAHKHQSKVFEALRLWKGRSGFVNGRILRLYNNQMYGRVRYYATQAGTIFSSVRPRTREQKKSPVKFLQICIPKRDYLPENQIIWQAFSSMCTGP